MSKSEFTANKQLFNNRPLMAKPLAIRDSVKVDIYNKPAHKKYATTFNELRVL